MVSRAVAPPAKETRRRTTSTPPRPKRRGRPPLWRNPAMVAAMAAVVVAVGVIVGISLHGGQASPASGTSSSRSQTQASSNVMAAVTGVDAGVIAQVGTAGLPNKFYALNGAPPLTAGGKPQVLYVGADYCPYCAAQRWSMVVALSRFGSFENLALTTSADNDVYPNTATFSFSGVRYSSQYLDFAAVETADRNGSPKEQMTATQKHLLDTYDVPPYVPANAAGGIPWIDVAGRYATVSSGFTPQILAGLDWEQIAARLGNAGDLVTQGIVGNANNITATICKVTGMQPAGVCDAAPIAQVAAQLP